MVPSPPDVDEIDHYKVLDLPSGEEGSRLTADQIEKAYKTQSRLRHPDKRPDDPNATSDFQLLRASYDVLRDEQTRRAFDAKLRAWREKEVRDLARDGKRRKLAADLEKRERAAERGEPLDAAEMERRRERSVANELKRELDAFLSRNVRRSEPASASASASVCTRVLYMISFLFVELVNWESKDDQNCVEKDMQGLDFMQIILQGMPPIQL